MYLLYLAGTYFFAHGHPDLAMLGDSEWLAYRQSEMAAKNHLDLNALPSTSDPLAPLIDTSKLIDKPDTIESHAPPSGSAPRHRPSAPPAICQLGGHRESLRPRPSARSTSPEQDYFTLKHIQTPLSAAKSYQRPLIHFAPRIVSQTAAPAAVITMTAASRAIESRSPSSSR